MSNDKADIKADAKEVIDRGEGLKKVLRGQS